MGEARRRHLRVQRRHEEERLEYLKHTHPHMPKHETAQVVLLLYSFLTSALALVVRLPGIVRWVKNLLWQWGVI